ncbi:Patatin-like serine hydrolase [Penicillium verhagenii]|uniref:Patatin-like serine hydrolase n=1 Tax=Penicillium verhagenii TaxID=1562060 RepID=UPI002544E99A|nr:Patatin-like serine hydrolase [Penicillium verhagenii]KAJ5921086.1 Patatin-like serine hydrolase [Penicillium verhagenii]
MQNSIDIGWLEIGIREDSSLAVLDHRRLRSVIAELFNPENQYPSLCTFLGGKTKDHALQQLYPLNNIKRHISDAQIRLRYDISSLGSQQPTLLADGDIPSLEDFSALKVLQAGQGWPVSWESKSARRILIALWSRLVFCFTDVICIFLDNDDDVQKVVSLLLGCLNFGSASQLPKSLLPKAIFIYNTTVSLTGQQYLNQKIEEAGYKDLTQIFSSTTIIYISDESALSNSAQFYKLKSIIGEQVDLLSSIRQEYHGRPNGNHFLALFQSAVDHMLHDVTTHFDVVKAMRKDRPVNMNMESYLQQAL